MAKLVRKLQKIFAKNATNNGQFGSAQLGTKIETDDLDIIQALSAWENGWLDATLTAQRLPPLEEMQGIQYTFSTQLAYMFQEGVPEWNSQTTYYEKSIVKFAGTSELYVSIVDDNIGNLPSDPTKWTLAADLLKVNYTDETTVTAGDLMVTADTFGRKLEAFSRADLFSLIYPIGSVYINATVATNPATLLGFGTWTAFGAGRVPVGIDVSDPTFDTAGEEVGSKDAVVVSHGHSVNDSGHTHLADNVSTVGSTVGKWLYADLGVASPVDDQNQVNSATTGITINSAGVSGTNANIQPSIVVYMWRRTA